MCPQTGFQSARASDRKPMVTSASIGLDLPCDMYTEEQRAVIFREQFLEMCGIAFGGLVHRTIVGTICEVQSNSCSVSRTVCAMICAGSCAFKATPGALTLSVGIPGLHDLPFFKLRVAQSLTVARFSPSAT